MPTQSIVHTTVKQNAPAAGAQGQNQGLFSSDWNANHAFLAPGFGMQILSDGGNPPTFTFLLVGGTTSTGGSLIPAQDNTYDVGQITPLWDPTSPLRWRNGFFNGTVSAGRGVEIEGITPGLGTSLGGGGGRLGVLVKSGAVLEFQNSAGTVTTGGFYPSLFENSLKIAGMLNNSAVRVVHTQSSLVVDSGQQSSLVEQVTAQGQIIAAGLVSAGSGFQTNSATGFVLGNPPNTQATITVTGSGLTFTSNNSIAWDGVELYPTTDSIRDLGTSSFRWRDIHMGGTIINDSGHIVLQPSSTNPTRPAIDNNTDLGSTSFRWRTLLSYNINIAGNILTSLNPSPTATLDLGAAALQWRLGFFSSTVSAGGFQTNDTTVGVTTPLLFYATALKISVNGQSLDVLGGGAPVFVAARPMVRWDSAGNLVVNSNNSASADLYLNFDSNRNTIFGGSAGNNVRPQTDGVVDLGINSTNRWRVGYFSSAVSVGTSFIINDAPNGQYKFVTTLPTMIWGVSSTNTLLHTSGVFSPVTDNSVDLGDSVTPRRWKNAYFAGTVSVGGTIPGTVFAAMIVQTGNFGTGSEPPTNNAGKYLQVGGSGNAGWYLGTSAGITWAVDNNGGSLRFFTPGTSRYTFDVTQFTALGTSLVSAGGGYQTNTSLGYIAGSSGVFRAQNADGSKWIQITHDGTTPLVNANSGTLTFITGTTVYDFSTNAGELRLHGTSGNGLFRLSTAGDSQGRIFFSNGMNNLYISSIMSVGGSIYPDTDAAFDFGGVTGISGLIANRQWRNGYISGVMSAGGIGTGGVFTTIIAVPGNTELAFKTIGATGVITDRLHLGSGNLYPITVMDLGIGTGNPNDYRNIYAYNTISAGAGFQTNAGSVFGGNITTTKNGVYSLGDSTNLWSTVYASNIDVEGTSLKFRVAGVSKIEVDAGQAYPTTDTSMNLGTNGNRFGVLYLSSTASAGSTVDAGTTMNGSVAYAKKAVNTTYGVAATDYLITTFGAGTFTITLPAAAGSNRQLVIVKGDATGVITVSRAGSDNIESATGTSVTTLTLTNQFDKCILMSDGISFWYNLADTGRLI